jgi:hypothetical protein
MMIVDLVADNPKNKFAPHLRMASAIVELTNRNGGCLPQDLFALGFTKEETINQWHMAYALASVELKLLKEAS